MNKDLSHAYVTSIETLLRKARSMREKGNTRECIKLTVDAWNSIPEPKSEWNFYPQIITRSLIKDYSECGERSETIKWIDEMAKMYNDPNHEDHLVLMSEADAMLKLGDRERAFYVIDRINELYGKEGFKGEHQGTYNFYLKEKAARNG